jgi:molybdopterin-containing oxidoreductase family membrane subunit
MPIYFILSAIISGAAILMFSSIITFWARGVKIKGKIYDSIQMLRVVLGFALVVDLFFIAWKFVSKFYFPSPVTKEALEIFLYGPLKINFWVFELGIGTLIPILILAIPITGRSVKWNLAASIMTIIGIFVLRYDLVIGGLLGKSISGITYQMYSPHVFEIMAVVGFFALTGLIYTIGIKILPILGTMEEKTGRGE